ncbi:Uridylate kinase [Trichinella pseudospiralis]
MKPAKVTQVGGRLPGQQTNCCLFATGQPIDSSFPNFQHCTAICYYSLFIPEHFEHIISVLYNKTAKRNIQSLRTGKDYCK